jgi:transaldolase/glucose-6-phosphate isomerase
MLTRTGVSGVTSNPAILEQALNKTDAYDEEVGILARRGLSADEIYQTIVIQDMAEAADILHQVYEATGGGDGYVSLEVSPTLARDTEGTVAEALRLWKLLNRDNVMISAGTDEGFGHPAADRRGININVTSSLRGGVRAGGPRLHPGLQDRLQGRDIRKIASVALVFVSRMYPRRQGPRQARDGGPTPRRRIMWTLKAQAAIATPLVYRRFQQLFAGPEWEKLAAAGCASGRSGPRPGPRTRSTRTSPTSRRWSAPNTVNTMPGALTAFLDHGRVQRSTIQDEVEGASSGSSRS